MKNPFEFAKELLRYCRGELSQEEKVSVEKLLSMVKGLEVLAGELSDKKRIENELCVVERFDVEKALARLKKRKYGRMRLLLPWVAASVVLISIPILLLLNGEQKADLFMPGGNAPAKAEVILEMASGLKVRLDTLTSVVCSDRDNVAFDIKEGLLKIEEQDSIVQPLQIVGYNTINVPYGGTYTVELCDGTKVYLNSGTRLEFPSRFDEDMRSVRLEGEAYFEVARNECKPFVVEVGEMKVKVLGTAFNVKSYVDEPGVYTTLVQGSIAILRNGQPEKELKPGEQAYYNKGIGTLSVSPVDVNEFTSWKDGLFYFKNIALEEILRIVSRWYDLEIFYANPDVKNVVYSGKLPMYTSVEDVLRKFEISGGVRFKLAGRTLTVFNKP